MINRTTSSRWKSPGKLGTLSLVALLILGLVLPAEALTWNAKLRGKLTLAAALGAVAFVTEQLLHREQLQAEDARETLGTRIAVYQWREGFNAYRLERHIHGYLLLRNGQLAQHVRWESSPNR